MNEAGTPGSEDPSQSTKAASRDGNIRFSDYSDTQLSDLLDVIDPVRCPINYHNLVAERARRDSLSPKASSPGKSYLGRFTQSDGIQGWVRAKRARSPVYGPGSIEVRSGELVINGWQRTWLATPLQVQIAYPSDAIRNVVQDAALLSFEIRSRFRLPNRISFTLESSTAAASLAAELPDASTPGFARQWIAVRDFNARLRSVARTPIVTPTLVSITTLAFIALCVKTKQWGNFDAQTLINCGANFGPLTVNGQWWRLFTALLLHINLAHLLFNMWALWNIGRLCELLFGRFTLSFLYLSCGVLASLSSIVWNPAVAGIGASGAVFGVFGAFLAFYFNPRNRVPPSIARQHWVSTSAFVIFSLLNGGLHPGIDNAAHVGGLLGGFALGWILARPFEMGRRRSLAMVQCCAAAAFVLFAIVMAIWQVKGIGSELTMTEQYRRQHRVYVEDESKNIQLWNELAAKAAAGTISQLELGERFERDVIPFWTAAHAQFDKENSGLKGPQLTFGLLVADLVRLRLDWAEKVLAAVKTNDPQLAAEAQTYIQKTMLAQARLERIELRSQMDHRPRALANSPIVSKVRNLLTGYRWQCVHRPASWSPIPIAADNLNDGPSARNRIGCLAQQLFMTGDYQELDSMMARYVQTLADLPDGSSHYEGIFAGLDNLFEFGGIDSLDLLGRTADWRRSVKKSRRADLAESMIFQASAWWARGHGSADSVSAQGWAQFAYRTEMAAETLVDIKNTSARDPVWYAERLSVALDQAWGETEIRAIFDEGTKLFPDYRPIERRMLRILMPRWKGSYDKVDELIDSIYQRTAPIRGFERYAELYSEYADLEGDDLDLFSDTKAFWSGIRSGYIGLIKRYPASDFVLNRFANMACRAGDGEQYENLRKSITVRYSSVAWSPKFSRENCDAKFAAVALATTRAANESRSESSSQIVRTLGGIQLGISPADLFQIKGGPLPSPYENWSYSIGKPPHHGVLMAVFSPKTDTSDPKLVSVEFTGDEVSAPPDLPYLNGLTEGDLKDRFGYLIGMGVPSEGVTRYRFKNGVYADARDGRVFRYGIYTAKL